jgi:predicted lipoprotein with Yx(FWY)xxD motif
MKLPRLRLRPLLPMTLLLVAVVALAACGSDSTSTTKASSSSSSTPTTAAATVAVIKTADNATLGTILVDAEGKTVYTLTMDGAAVACTGACLQAWPPVLLPSGTTTATGGDGVKDLGVVSGGDQVTSTGLPLYTFAADAAAGDAKGEGLSSFGGTWHVVKVSGGAATSESSSTTSTTKGGSGY